MTMRRGRLAAVVGALGMAILGPCALAGAADEPFYKGKILRIIASASPGGAYDLYSRAIARHIPKYLPGAPTVIVENMAGAGTLIGANYTYKIAKPDGLTFTIFSGGFFLGQILGQPGIEFDARKFEYVGAPIGEHPACVMTVASGITSLDRWMTAKTPVKLGGLARGAHAPDNIIKILQAALGLPIQLVSGYRGLADIRLAAEGGELAGSCWDWASISGTWRKKLDSGEVVPVLQLGSRPHPDLPQVPVAITLAKTDEARHLIQVALHDLNRVARSYVLPPGTPKDRVELLRRAFVQTLRDPEYLAETKKGMLESDPVPGEEVERIVHGLFRLDPAMAAKLKGILYQ